MIIAPKYKKRYYKKIIIIKKKFFRKKKNFVVVETYNGKPHSTRTKANCRKRGIKNYKNMSAEKLLSTLDKSECNF